MEIMITARNSGFSILYKTKQKQMKDDRCMITLWALLIAMRIPVNSNDQPSEQVQWDVLLSSPVIGCVATEKFCSVTCSDATLHCFSVNDGSRLTTAIKLQGPATLLRAQDHFVAVVTTQGQINVWDITKKKSVVKTSILHLVDQGN